MTLVTLVLVFLGSECPTQARVGRQREKAPSWHTALGQNRTDRQQDEVGVMGQCLSWVGRRKDDPTRLWTCGPGAG